MAGSLFQALGGSPQAPAAPGSPGVAAAPQDQLPGLYDMLKQNPAQSDPNAALQLGPQVAANDQVPQSLADSLRNAFGGSSGGPAGTSVPGAPSPSPSPVNPFSNFANKATGKSYR